MSASEELSGTAESVAGVLGRIAARLRASGVPEPRAEARRLVELATGLGREQQMLRAGSPLPEGQVEALDALASRRCAREPMAYLRGSAPFWDWEVEVRPGILVPRPETETLIEEALARRPDRSAGLRMLDLGVGSGCLVLTLLRLWPAASGVGVDLSDLALAVTATNAERLGVAVRLSLIRGSWDAAPAGPFDLIVSNPPYVTSGELDRLEPEVRLHEPRDALVAGKDGLDAYRALIPEATRRLQSGGLLLLELGQGQAPAVRSLVESAGLRSLGERPDLAGIARCLAAERP